MPNQHPPQPEPPPPPPAAGALRPYQGIALRIPTQIAALSRNMPNYQPTGATAELAFPYIICGIWIGISFTLVFIGSTIVLAVFSAIVNSRSFPNIQAMHQIASSNDRTFKMAVVLYILSVGALFVRNRGRLPFEECWWACMQVFCGVQMVFLLFMVAVWIVPQVVGLISWIIRSIVWACKRMLGMNRRVTAGGRQTDIARPRGGLR